MDVSRYRRKRIAIEVEQTNEQYPHNLSLYSVSPKMHIQLSQFEDLAIERVRVLKIIEYASLVGAHIFSDEWKHCVYAELKKQHLNKYLRLIRSDTSRPSDMQARIDDSISHHILRLAYCRTEQQRKWFLRHEMDLFRLRLSSMNEESISEFMKCEMLDYHPLSNDDIGEYRDAINCSTIGVFVLGVTKFYKVEWHEVLPLAAHHKVFLRNGFAYVPNYELNHCLTTIFRRRLSEYLAVAARRIDAVIDSRLDHIFRNLHEGASGIQNEAGRKSHANDVTVTASNIDMYAKANYPLCMRAIHDEFRAEHHLKHAARLQYLLFLKGIGMLYEEAIQFWRDEFTRKFDESTFNKKYEYGVKHCYGMVGQKLNYSPYGCAKLISQSVGAMEAHGCPYRHWDVTALVEKLQAFGLDGASIKDIADTKQAGHYQIACGKFFKAVHQQTAMHAVDHPNSYFNDSCKIKYPHTASASKSKADDIGADITMNDIS